MTLKREIKDAYIENGASIYVKTHSDAVYVDENETETLTERLDNLKGKIDNNISQLNDMAKNKQDKIIDSGWIVLPLTNGIAYTEGLTPRYRLVGKELRCIGMCNGYTTINTIIGTLPAGYRPISDFTCIARCGQNKYAEINVSYNGIIKLVNFSDTLTSNITLDVSCISFFIG